MGISLGQSFGHLVFALVNVWMGFVKKSIRSFFHNNVLQMCSACVFWGMQPLAVAECHQLFQCFSSAIKANFSGGALAVGRAMLALNTLGGKTSTMTRLLEPQTGQLGLAVDCSVTTRPELGNRSCNAGVSSS